MCPCPQESGQADWPLPCIVVNRVVGEWRVLSFHFIRPIKEESPGVPPSHLVNQCFVLSVRSSSAFVLSFSLDAIRLIQLYLHIVFFTETEASVSDKNIFSFIFRFIFQLNPSFPLMDFRENHKHHGLFLQLVSRSQ